MQPPMEGNLEEFLALSSSIGDQQEAVTKCAQQLLKVNEFSLRTVASSG